jgi:hypothetical protein
MSLIPAFVIGNVLFAVLLPSQSNVTTAIDQGYRDMYNLDFAGAHRCFAQWEMAHPNDPLAPASDAAAYLFDEFDRLQILQSEFFTDDSKLERKELKPDPAIKQRFDAALMHSQQLAERRLKQCPNDETALFANVLRLGLQADYLALIEKRYLDSLDAVKKARLLAQHLLALDPGVYDAYLAIGVENYLLSLKSAPVRWILRLRGAEADREKGLSNLRLTAQKGRYLQPYGELLLALAALRDKNQARAKVLLLDLATRFPQNHLYREELAKLH